MYSVNDIAGTGFSRACIDIVRRAAGLMKGPFEIEEKDGIENIVTSADKTVQKYLCSELSVLLPGCGFICEEDDVHDPDKEYVWIIDPIDGTANFARGIGECAISVALKHGDSLLLGVVYSPERGEMYHAEAGKGAFLNDKPICVSKRSFDRSFICTAMSTYRKEYASLCNDVIMDLFPVINDYRRFGVASLEICMLAAGKVDLYFEMRLQPWDYAAGILILEEAGGVVCDLDARRPSFDGPDLVVAANCQENLDILLATVRRHIPQLPYCD